MQTVIENEHLSVVIDHFGAELKSIKSKTDGTEYLWNADARYWKRSAPVLFPFVGSVKDKCYMYEGQKYPMGQHGFARDNMFSLLSAEDNEAWFFLEDNEETRKVYPFSFRLEIGYRIDASSITVFWRVKNPMKTELYYSIGGHPAFMCPVNGKGVQSDYSLVFDVGGKLVYSRLSENGLVESKGHQLLLSGNRLKISEHLFDDDALIFEGSQAHRIGLVDPDGRNVVTVSFDAPLFGLWSPTKKNAPFVCIEPWYGRCDAESFEGTIAEREYEEQLPGGGTKEYSYVIEIG